MERLKEKYNEARKESNYIRENNDCSVIALSMVYDKSYSEIHRLLSHLGRKQGRGFNTITAIKTLGRASKPIYPKQPNGSLYTIKTIVDILPVGKFLIFTKGHVLACIDGEIYDWTEDRKHRVIKVIEIDKIDLFDLL